MRILITNDDGIESPGLHAAYKALKLAGHQVTAVAPDRERSGQSHSANFFTYLRVNEATMPDGSPAFTVSGTPADCANIGCLSLIKDPIDLVVSGINTDTNIGYDANYSGTVGAALEAAALGYPALAVSQENSPSVDWELAGQITARAVSLYQGWDIPIGTMVNLNVPAKITDPTWLWVPLNLVAVREYYVIDMDSEGVRRYQRTRDQPHSTYTSGSDVDFLRRGRITLSPLGPVRSERRTLERLQSQTLERQTPERQTDEP